MYKALNVPVARLEQESQFSLGRSTEISRDEVKFQKFIDRLRNRFSQLFLRILAKQLVLKKVITEADWSKWERDIKIDYNRDNHFAELKETGILNERLGTLDMVQPYVGEYFTKDWIMKKVLKLSEEEMKNLEDEVEKENDENADKMAQQQQQEPEMDPNQQMPQEDPNQMAQQQPEAPSQGQNVAAMRKQSK